MRLSRRAFVIIFAFFLSLPAAVCSASAGNDSSPSFKLYEPGTEDIVDYEKYGAFSGIGTFDYKYTITNTAGLARASGEGIDPNTSIQKDPAYKEFATQGKIAQDYWKHVNSADPQADFYAWATAYKENPGVRLFFTGRALENAGLYTQALKAYRAAILLYPDSFCWNRAITWTWLIAPAAWDAIINITRMHPEVGVKLVDSFVKTEIAIDGDPRRNHVAITPGHFIPFTAQDQKKVTAGASARTVISRRGGKKVACIKYSNGQWALEVDGQPFIVKGLTYNPTKVGEKYDWDWMHADQNKNGINDVAYETWVDKNRNNRRDDNEVSEGDFKLMQQMGCNTIRIFNTIPFNKELLRDMFRKYGIRVLICDPVGAYTVHSGARWEIGTDYTDPDQVALMKDAVAKTVREFKNEEWLLGYILGNENNMPLDYAGVNASRTQATAQPKEYARFLNETAALIHSLDPNHIVGVGNMELGLMDAYALYAPELDFVGINSYAGSNGFGALWIRAKALFDRPVLITEFGCDAYATARGVDEESQNTYLKNAWEDIVYNTAGNPGEGNSIGGMIFEWIDEWWKDTRSDPLDNHNTEPTCELALPDGFSQEEWFGIVGQATGRLSPFIRVPRKAYYTMKELWTK